MVFVQLYERQVHVMCPRFAAGDDNQLPVHVLLSYSSIVTQALTHTDSLTLVKHGCTPFAGPQPAPHLQVGL